MLNSFFKQSSSTDIQYIPGSQKPSFGNALMGVKSYSFDCISNGQQIGEQMQFIDAYFIEEMKQWCNATCFPQVNQLNGKTLPSQVEIASKSVCLIIVNGD